MNGDIIRRLRQYRDLLGHIHTAGVPGRAEIDECQEIHYPAIMRTLVDIGYTGLRRAGVHSDAGSGAGAGTGDCALRRVKARRYFTATRNFSRSSIPAAPEATSV